MTTFVAVTAGLAPAVNGKPERATLNTAYIAALEGAGLVPLIITPGMTNETIAAIVAASGGLCLTGGGDIDPARYGQPLGPKTTSISEARDTAELAALVEADRLTLPVLAICRGMQLLNVARGGSLHQDIPNHSQTTNGTPRDALTHTVRLEPDGCLARILGGDRVETNSMHHQAVDQIGANLVASGWAEDETIEALVEPGERFVIGVQWHPEELIGVTGHAERLFRALADACAGWPH